MDLLKTLNVTSTSFTNGGKIPEKYTCDGLNISPPINWGTIPSGTQSFAVIFFDTSAQCVHMVLYNLPPTHSGLPEDVFENFPEGALFGMNDINDFYFGPCPPPNVTNEYFCYVYALDCVLTPDSYMTMGQLQYEMGGHILAWGELLGQYR